MPLMSTCTGKSSPHALLMPWMISHTKRARFSKLWGPYLSSRWLRLRERNAWPMLLPAALISTASKPASWSMTATSMKSCWTCLTSSSVRSSASAHSNSAAVVASNPLKEAPMSESW